MNITMTLEEYETERQRLYQKGWDDGFEDKCRKEDARHYFPDAKEGDVVRHMPDVNYTDPLVKDPSAQRRNVARQTAKGS